MPAKDDVRRAMGYALSSDPMEAELGLAADPTIRQQQLFGEGGALLREMQRRRARQQEQQTTSIWDPKYWSGLKHSVQERPDVAGAEMVSGMTGERMGPPGISGTADIQRDLAAVLFGPQASGHGKEMGAGVDPQDVEEYFKSRELTSRYDEGLPQGTRAQLETAGTLGEVGVGVGAGMGAGMLNRGTGGVTRAGLSEAEQMMAERIARQEAGGLTTLAEQGVKREVTQGGPRRAVDPTLGGADPARVKELYRTNTQKELAEGMGVPEGEMRNYLRRNKIKKPKGAREHVREKMQEAIDPDTGVRMEEGYSPAPGYEQMVREARARQGMLSPEIERGLSERPFRAVARDEPIPGGASYREGIGAEPSRVKLSRESMAQASPAQRQGTIGHETAHGSVHGLERQAPDTSSGIIAEHQMMQRIRSQKQLDRLGEYAAEMRGRPREVQLQNIKNQIEAQIREAKLTGDTRAVRELERQWKLVNHQGLAERGLEPADILESLKRGREVKRTGGLDPEGHQLMREINEQWAPAAAEEADIPAAQQLRAVFEEGIIQPYRPPGSPYGTEGGTLSNAERTLRHGYSESMADLLAQAADDPESIPLGVRQRLRDVGFEF